MFANIGSLGVSISFTPNLLVQYVMFKKELGLETCLVHYWGSATLVMPDTVGCTCWKFPFIALGHQHVMQATSTAVDIVGGWCWSDSDVKVLPGWYTWAQFWGKRQDHFT